MNKLNAFIIRPTCQQSIKHFFAISKYIWCFFFTLICCILFSGCAQISSLQTAKTLSEDEQVVGFSAFGYGVKETDLISGPLGLAVFPYVEAFGRKGFTQKFDAGLKISSSGNIAIDGKYQFWGDRNSKFAMASGLTLEYQFVANFESFVSRQTIPLYLSYHPNAGFAVYLAPKLLHQWVIGDENMFFPGSNFGVQKRISNRFSMVAEGSVFWLFDQRFKSSGDFIYQGGLGFVFDL